MPYTLKTQQISVKDPDSGEYIGVDVLSEQTKEGLISELQTEGNTQVARINQAAVDVQSAVDQAETEAQQLISSTQSSLNTLETQKDTIAQTIASMAELGTDTTLTTTGMAADAKATGDEISNVKNAISDITGNIVYSWKKDVAHYVNTVLTESISLNFASVLVSCSPGDIFNVKGSGGVDARLWIFADSNGTKIVGHFASVNTKTLDYIQIQAPSNAAYLAVNSATNDGAYTPGLIKGITVDDRLEKLPEIEESVSALPSVADAVDIKSLPCVKTLENISLVNSGRQSEGASGYTTRMFDCSTMIGRTIHVTTGVNDASILMAGFFNSSTPSESSLVRRPDGWGSTSSIKNLDSDTTVAQNELYLAIVTYTGKNYGVYDKTFKQSYQQLESEVEDIKTITDLVDEKLISYVYVEDPVVSIISGKKVNTSGQIVDDSGSILVLDVNISDIVTYSCAHGADGTAILSGFKNGEYVKTLLTASYNPAVSVEITCDGTYDQIYFSKNSGSEFQTYTLTQQTKTIDIQTRVDLKGKVIYFEGDSITEATNDTQRGWAERAGKPLEMEWYNKGNSGASIVQPPTQPGDTLTSRASILYDVLSRDATGIDYMIISGGYNDAMSYGQQILDYTDYRKWIPADDYDPEESYAVGDVVLQSNTLYHCTSPTTGSFDSSKWSAIPTFSSSSSYQSGDYIVHNGFVYKCINSHSGAFEKTNAQRYSLGDFQLIPAKSDFDITTTIGAFEFLLRYATTHFPKVGYILCYNFKALNWNTKCAPKLKEVCEKWGVPCIDLRYTAGFNLYSDDCAVKYGAMSHQGYVPRYPDNAPYAIDSIVQYGGILYKALEAIPANPGAFDPTKYDNLSTTDPTDYDHQHCRADGYEKLSTAIMEWIKTL